MIIRYAHKDEMHLIKKIAFDTWPVAYKNILSDGQLQYMLVTMYDVEALISQVEKLSHQFVIAIDDLGSEIGFASFSVFINQPTKYKLHKLYVLPNHQGKKVGRMLLNFVLEETKKNKKITSILLNVNRKNDAVEFYLKNGFYILNEEDNDIGQGYFMNDYVMQIDICI